MKSQKMLDSKSYENIISQLIDEYALAFEAEIDEFLKDGEYEGSISPAYIAPDRLVNDEILKISWETALENVALRGFLAGWIFFEMFFQRFYQQTKKTL